MSSPEPDLTHNYLETIQRLYHELIDDESVTRSEQILMVQLDHILYYAEKQNNQPAAVLIALDIIEETDEARERLEEIMRERGLIRSYTPPPGQQPALPPGTLMVCPVDPNHYQKRLRTAGQRLKCPQHGKDLVPAKQQTP